MTDTAVPVFEAQHIVSFGDCDPAGIVFYPNIFAWLDRTFHAYLRDAAGGHAAVCEALGLKGVGLTEANCAFRAPLSDGDVLDVCVDTIDWGERGFQVNYRGRVGERTAFTAHEGRALFVERDGRLRAGDAVLLEQHLAKSTKQKQHAD
ncbi:MAG: acyl-CoA thioesterase [Pseudomonadota bacterium]